MSYFPLCIDLSDKRVLLIGDGPQIREKEEKLRPFGPCLVRLSALSSQDLCPRPVLVVAGDLEEEAAQLCSRLCQDRNIPVNIVDRPELCSFFFPALIHRGDLTVSLSTGGKSPAAAAFLRHRIEDQLPDQTEQILSWMDVLRQHIRLLGTAAQRRAFLTNAAMEAFSQNRCLSESETRILLAAHLGEYAYPLPK